MQPTESIITSNAEPKIANEKHLNIPAITMTLIAIVFAGLAIFFGIRYFNNQPAGGESEQSAGDNVPSSVVPSDGGGNIADVEEASDSPAARDSVLTFDNAKIQNGMDGINYILMTNQCENDINRHGSALCIFVDDSDATKVHIRMDRTAAVRQYGEEVGPADGTVLDYDVEFDQKVKSIYLAGEGQEGTHDTVLYILEDGTVAYTPVVNAIKKASFRALGTLTGVSDAAKFYTLNVNGGFQTAYQKSNGDIYILTLCRINVDGLDDEIYCGVMQ